MSTGIIKGGKYVKTAGNVTPELVFSELTTETEFSSTDEVIIKKNGVVYKGSLGDLLKTAVEQLNATNVNATNVAATNGSIDIINSTTVTSTTVNGTKVDGTKVITTDIIAGEDAGGEEYCTAAIKLKSTQSGNDTYIVLDGGKENDDVYIQSASEETYPENNKIVTKGTLNDSLAEYVKVYRAQGLIASTSGSDDTLKGYGIATVFLFANGIAKIDYVYKLETTGISTTNFTWGLSAKSLHARNSNIPLITPVSGGVRYEDSEVDNGYGISQEASEYWWVPSRIYTTDGNNGRWRETMYSAGSIIKGTCYGTYTA